MQPTFIGIPLSRLPPYEAGAALISYLAFPEPGSDADAQRADAQVALCNRALHTIGAEDEGWCWSTQPLKPGYLLMSDNEVARHLRTFDSRIKDRLVAARMAIPFLQRAEAGFPLPLPKGVPQLSIARLAEYVRPSTSENSPVNVRSRIWTPSLPVIHVAVATELVLDMAQKANVPQLGVFDLIRAPEFTQRVVTEAEKCEVLLTRAPKLKLALDRLIRFRLT